MPISLNALGVNYTQDFDTLSNATGTINNALTIPGWYLTESLGGSRDNEQYAVNNGGSNTGDTYSYGADGSTERALGTLRSGSLDPVFGAFFTNDTGSTITSLNISYTGEEWRLGSAGRTDHLNFEYQVGASEGERRRAQFPDSGHCQYRCEGREQRFFDLVWNHNRPEHRSGCDLRHPLDGFRCIQF